MAGVEYRMAAFLCQQGKLLHRGKDNAAGFALAQQLAQGIAVIRLHRLLAQQLSCGAKGSKQLAVKVVAVGNHHQRRVVHFRLLQQLTGIATHGNTFARPLGMPDHPGFFTARHYPVGIAGPFVGGL